MSIDEKLAKLRELTAERDRIDAQIASLRSEVQSDFSTVLAALGTPGKSKKAGTVRKCSTCGELGHRATTCPKKKAA